MNRRRQSLSIHTLAFCLALMVLSGCHQDMKNQPRFEPYEKTTFFTDGRSSRTLVDGTIARGQLESSSPFYTGKANGQYTDKFPIAINEQVIRRGQDRYNIYCSVCHDAVGSGTGMIVRRGFPKPTAFTDERLKKAAPGYLFTVISHGLGNMPAYENQLSYQDRWAIVAYMRVLQQSQATPFSELPANAQKHLTEQS